MRLERVTITGADDKVSHEDIIDISEKFPFVEWGILFSPSRTGQRYPTLEWIKGLKEKVGDKKIKFSAHLCGGYTRDILETGGTDSLNDIRQISSLFKRVQLNFNATKHFVSEEFYSFIKKYDEIKFIIQVNEANHFVCQEIFKRRIPADLLWDSSGGRGVADDNVWALPFFSNFTGYAGGLTPDNLEEKLSSFFKLKSNTEIWIDTESGVRTNNNDLDLNKVLDFLNTSSKYTKNEMDRNK